MVISIKDIERGYGYVPRAEFNYSINISQENSFIYNETAKVACSTIKKTLQNVETEALGRPPLPSSRDIHNKKKSPLSSPSDIGINKLCEMLSDSNVFKFAFVRNPYTRALSAYLDKIQNSTRMRNKIEERLNVSPDENISFESFLSCVKDTPVNEMDTHWRPLTYQLLFDIIEYDFIGRFENLEADIRRVLDIVYSDKHHLRKTITKYSPHSTQAAARLSSFYTKNAQNLVRQIYAQDFEIFEYSLELPLSAETQIN